MMKEIKSLYRQGGWAAIGYFLLDVAVAYAVGYAINVIFGPKKQDPRIISPKYSDNQEMVRSAVEPHKVVYGRSVVSGPLLFAATNGANNQYLHVVVPFTGHEVDAIEAVYFDDIDSTSPTYNKLEVWKVVGIAGRADVWYAALQVDGIVFIGGASSSYSGNHSRIKTTNDVMSALVNAMIYSTGYASRNYTVAWTQGYELTITAKTIGTEISVQAMHYQSSSILPNHWLGVPAPGTGATFYVGGSAAGSAFMPYVNDLVETAATKAHIFDLYTHLGTSAQTANSNLVAENVGWTSNHRLRGRAYVYTKLNYIADRWPTGMPVIKAKIRGKKVYDPRSTLTAWSENAALCIRDYLTASYGLACSVLEIDDPSFIAAANISDEYVLASTPKNITSSSAANPTLLSVTNHQLRTGDSVQIASHTGSTPSINGTHTVTVLSANTISIPVNVTVGGTGGTIQLRQKRYTCNGTIALGERPIDVMQKLLTSCDGTLVYTNGKYALFAGAYSSPVGTLNESHLRGAIGSIAKPPRRSIFNAVRGTFVDPTKFYQETDFPVYDNATYQTQDGGEYIPRDITLPFTNDVFEAQRRAKQVLEVSRQGILVTYPAKLTAFKYSVNDVIQLSISYFGWVNKEFRIKSWSLTEDFGVDYLLQEESSASYAWNNGDETILDAAPDTSLPNPFNVAAPTGVTAVEELYQAVNTSGIKTRIRVNWVASTDANIQNYIVYWYSYADSEQAVSGVSSAHSLPTQSTTFYIEDLSPGYYYITIKAFNHLGVSSLETTPVQCIAYGNTVNPENVTGFNAYQNGELMVFTWLPISDVDLLGYEVRYGPAATTTWETATQITRAERGTEITSALVPPGSWKFFIKAQDTTGLYSITAATDSVIVISRSNVVLSIEHETDWLGTLTNFVRHWTGKLMPDDQNSVSSYTNFEWCDTYVPTPYEVCTYVTPEIDTTFDDTLRVWAGVVHELGPGVVVGQANAVLEVDYHTTAGAYDGYETTSIGFREGRYWKFKLTHNTTIGKGVITEFQTALDKQAVTQEQQNVAVASEGTTITFQNPYHRRPTVSVTPQGTTPLVAAISSVTTTGFTVRLYNSGVATAGTIDYSVTGA